MIPYPHIDPVLVALGPLKVRWYGIAYVMGFLAAWWLAKRRAMRPGSTWTAADVEDLIFFAVFGVVLGGRLGYLLFYGQEQLSHDPSYWYKVWEGGMSFHGGLIGVLTALCIYAYRRGRRIGDVFDFVAPIPGIGILFGRIANFINGELWGRPTDLPWGVAVPTQDGVVVLHASQLYEGLLEGLLTFVVLWVFTARPRPRWAPAGLFLSLYAVCRILVEFVRVPDAQLGYLAGGWLTMGMALSLPMLVAGGTMIAVAYVRKFPSGNLTVGTGG
jgi:phosphatidylglycerol:prolipoprotein diacylglycerol transferase